MIWPGNIRNGSATTWTLISVGVNIFVVKALAPEIDLATIFKSACFFLIACIVCTIILIIFPQIVLVIPNMMR